MIEDRLKAASQAATPGPWEADDTSDQYEVGEATGWFRKGPGHVDVGDFSTLSYADATLIALSRNLAEPLADVVSAARAWVDFISGPSNPNYMDHAEEHAGRWETLTAALARLDEKEPQDAG